MSLPQIKLLLIEDDEDDALLTRDLLRQAPEAHYAVEWARTAAQGLDLLCAARHDVCLLDCQLGAQSGLDLLKAARARHVATPVIVLTGGDGLEMDLAAMEAGAADYLTKGQITPPLLERSIRYSMQQARSQAALQESYEELERKVEERTAELREANEHLVQSEQRFRETFENAEIGITHLDPQGRWMRVNRKFCEILGYTREELLARSLRAITYPEDVDADLIPFARMMRGEIERYELEKRYVHKDGHIVWTTVTRALQRDANGRPLYAISSVQDYHVRKMAEMALLTHNERQTLLSDVAGVLLGLDDKSAMVRRIYQVIAQHLHVDVYFNYMVTPRQDQPLRLDSYAGLEPDDATRAMFLQYGQALCGSVAQLRQPIYVPFVQQSEDPKAQMIRRLGVRVYASHPLLARERLIGTLSVASRTSDAFTPDELDFLRILCHYLALALDRLQLEEDLRQKVQQLGEADRRKDEFLAMLAHELRNPLAPIRYAAQMLHLTGADPVHLQRQREVIDRQVTHMARLLDDLLDVSRITRGKITLQQERLDLRAIVQHVVETSRESTSTRAQTITFDNAPAPLWVHGDVTRLEQVVRNLINNSIKYTEPGGHIGVALAAEATQSGAQAVVRIRDTGVGIAPEMLERVFELFAQADQSLDRSQGGLGIGLTMVQRIVKMHGGTVVARSEGLGKGSEFIVRLPLLQAPQAQEADDPGAHSLSPAERIRRVLVVDDNHDAATSLAELLSIRGYQARVAHDGPGALQAALEMQPDMILLDIGLPGMSGYDVARAVRRNPALEGTLLVALTGYGQDEDRQRAHQAGFDRHFTKPVNLDDLNKLLVSRR